MALVAVSLPIGAFVWCCIIWQTGQNEPRHSIFMSRMGMGKSYVSLSLYLRTSDAIKDHEQLRYRFRYAGCY